MLVVEDEYFIAQDVAAALRRHGADVVGPVGELAQAIDLVGQEHLDAAILDINLRGAVAYALADLLRARGVPFVFATGYGAEAIPAAYADVPRCEKPFLYEVLIAALPSRDGVQA